MCPPEFDGSVAQIDDLKSRMSDRVPEVDGSLFDTHRMMLEDKSFLDKIRGFIDDGFAAETALQFTIDEYVGAFGRMTDRYLRERATDVRDIGHRLLRNLLGVVDEMREMPEGCMLVAEELTLSDLAAIEPQRLNAIALATGGATSHATILAKSFEIPTVVGVDSLLETVQEGDSLVVDGNALAVANNMGVRTGSADVKVDGDTYTITGEAQGADIKNPMAGMITKKFEIKVSCS